LVVSQEQVFNIPLMEGWMTLPFTEDSDAWLSGHVDLDFNLGRIRNYADNARNTEDNHQGIDWRADEGTPILAIGPGVVIQEYAVAPSGAISLHILHQCGNRAFLANYGHVLASAVTLGQEVCRGEVVALSGKTGDTIPHLHLGLWEAPTKFDVQTQYTTILNYVYNNAAEVQYPSVGKMVPAVLDPFRDTTDPESVSMWTVDNEPQYASGQVGVAPESAKQAEFPQVLAEGDVTVVPPDGATDVPVDTSITLSFKHAISDRADIERRFAITPPGPGHFFWTDDHTLVFRRTSDLSYGTQYWVEFAPDWGSDFTVTFTTESTDSSPS
jgi:murein DD-endopeptidase MepM/ murein hydrolase activator NlpD